MQFRMQYSGPYAREIATFTTIYTIEIDLLFKCEHSQVLIKEKMFHRSDALKIDEINEKKIERSTDRVVKHQ